MSWDLLVLSGTSPVEPQSVALGTCHEVTEWIAQQVPSVSWKFVLPWRDSLAYQRGLDVYRRVMERCREFDAPSWHAYLEDSGLQVAFSLYGLPTDAAHEIEISFKGGGNPGPMLRAICQPRGWHAFSKHDLQPIDTSQDLCPQWEEFQQYFSLRALDCVCATLADVRAAFDELERNRMDEVTLSHAAEDPAIGEIALLGLFDPRRGKHWLTVLFSRNREEWYLTSDHNAQQGYVECEFAGAPYGISCDCLLDFVRDRGLVERTIAEFLETRDRPTQGRWITDAKPPLTFE